MSRGSTKQYIGIVDMLCEGPIHGLTDGKASVYINDIPFEDSDVVGTFNETLAQTFGSPKIFYDANSTTGNVKGITLTDNDIGKFVAIEVKSVANCTLSFNAWSWPASINFVSISGAGLDASFSTLDGAGSNLQYLMLESSEGVVHYCDGNFLSESDGVGTLTLTLDMPRVANQWTTTTNYWKVTLIKAVKIASITDSDTFVAEENISTTAVTEANAVDCHITDSRTIDSTVPDLTGTVSKVDASTVQFRRGTMDQAPLQAIHSLSGGVTVTGSGTGVALVQPDTTISTIAAKMPSGVSLFDTGGYPEGQTLGGVNGVGGDVLDISSSGGGGPNFGLSAAQRKQIDEVSIRINYPALITYNNEGGSTESANAIYVFQISLKGQGNSAFGEFKTLFSQTGGKVTHTAKIAAPISFDHTIGLSRFKPFDDFKIRIIRLTRHSGLPVWSNGTNGGRSDKKKWNLQANATIAGSDLSATIKDRFTYPFTAHAGVSFSSKTYSALPSRSYLLQGLKVRIPTAYTPREYTEDGVAKYEAFWNGDFKKDEDGTHLLYYTDNPAWVLYDIITNNRYGAGTWIDRGFMNKFALYRIAKYCDELVPDGKGGTEPRFRANLYLAKATEVYKVLKDMATVFLGMLYWLDGKVTPVQDVPGDPIANFSKANVIDGLFNYESTGRKTAANQVVVTWNDPAANYEQVPLIVEDREAIVKDKRIISENAVAMGATSEGQAYRYGRWKLWTAQNQREVVSFQTGLQGGFLRPGDVITIQDRDKHGVDYSGLVKSASSSAVTFDRAITSVTNANTFELATIVTRPAAFYVGLDPIRIDSNGLKVSVGGTLFRRGDRLTQPFWYPSSGSTFNLNEIDTLTASGDDIYDVSTEEAEKRVSNAFIMFAETGGRFNANGDSSGSGYNAEPLQLQWKPYSYVVTKTVSLNEDRTIATVSTSYETEEIPQNGTVWALNALDANGVQIAGTAKEYRILGITQEDSKNIYGINAVEHYNTKFDAVDKDYALGVTPQNTYPVIEAPEESVPAPDNVYITLDSDSSKPGEELTLTWTKPQETFTDAEGNTQTRDYAFLDRFEVFHNVPELNSPISVEDGFSLRFDKLEDALYTFRVRTVSRKQNYSSFISTQFEVTDQYGTHVPRIVGGLPKGIVSNSQFEYSFDSGSSTTEAIRFLTEGAAGFSVGNSLEADSNVATSLSSVNLAGLGLAAHREISGTPSWYWLMYDGGTHLGFWDQDSLETLPYYRKIPSGGWRGSEQFTAANSGVGFSVVGGSTNFTLAANSTRLKRTTAHGLTVRDIVLFENPNKLKATFISSITATASAVTIVTSTAHNLQDNDRVMFEQIGGMTSLNNQIYKIDAINSTSFKLLGTTSSDVTGSFTSGGWIRPVELQAARVMGVVDDNEVILDRSFSTAFIGTLYKAEYKADYKDDAVFGRVRWSENSAGANVFKVDKFITLDPSLSVGRSGLIETSIDAIQYEKGTDGTVTQTSTFSDIRATVTAVGFSNPEFRVSTLSSDFNKQSLLSDSFTGPDTAGGFSKEFIIHDSSALAKGNGSLLEVAVEIREASNVGINATVSSSIVRITDGAEGVDGKTVRLNAEDYSILYDSSGANPSHSGTVTVNSVANAGIQITATARNFTDALFRFKEADGSFGSYVDGTTPSATSPQTASITFAVPSTLPTDGTRVFEVEVAEKPPNYNSSSQEGTDSNGNTVTPTVQANDSISLLFVADGAGGIVVSNPNSAHAYAAEANGNPITTNDTIPNSDTTLEVLIGGIVGTYVGYGSDGNNLNTFTAGGFTGTLPAGSWYIASAVSSEGCFIPGKITAVTNNVVSIAPVDINTSHATYPGDNNETITWTIKVGTKDGEVEIKTVQSLSKSTKGLGAVGLSISNDNVSIVKDSNGSFDFSSTGSVIQVSDGTGNLQFITSGTPGAGEYTLDIQDTDVTTPSTGALTVSGKNAVLAAITAVTNPSTFTSGSRQVTATGKDAVGSDFTLIKTQTIASVAAGNVGARGKKTFNGYLYFQSASSDAPDAPSNSGVTMNFTTGVMSGGVIGTDATDWNQVAPTFAAAEGNKYWYVYYTAEEDGTYDSSTDTYDSQDITFGTVVYQGIGFSGLVVFQSDGNLSDGNSTFNPADIINSNTTTINGGKITATSITAAKLDLVSNDVINFLGFTPYNSTNPDGYQTATNVSNTIAENAEGFQTATNVNSLIAANPEGFQTATQVSAAITAAAPDLSGFLTTVVAGNTYATQTTVTNLTNLVNGKQDSSTAINTGNFSSNFLTNFNSQTTAQGVAFESELMEKVTADVTANSGDTTKIANFRSALGSTGLSQSSDFFDSNGNINSTFSSNLTSSNLFMRATLDGTSDAGLSVTSDNKLKLDASAISLTSSQVTAAGAITNTTSITGGRITLSSGSLDFSTSEVTGNNNIVLDTTSNNNRIIIYAGNTPRVILGKIS